MESLLPTPPPVPPRQHFDWLAVLRHGWWLVLGATLLGVVAAAGWARTQEPVWESTTSVLVHPAGQDTNVVGGRTQGEVNLDTEAQLVRSSAVAVEAAELLGGLPGDPDLVDRIRVEVPPNTSVLMITFADTTPAGARDGAHAFAEAYLRRREQVARAELKAQATAIDAKVDQLTSALAEINERYTDISPESAAAANLESRRGTVTNQLNAMAGRRDELATATVTPGTVISEARLPEEPSHPQPLVVLGSGAALGLVVGVGAAGLAERLVRRVRRPEDISGRLGIPVLATLRRGTAPERPRDELASPHTPVGRAFDRLRNEVISADRPDRAAGWVIVVTSAAAGEAASPTAANVTAANLAAAMCRCGYDVVLVGAGLPDPAGGGLAPLTGVAAAPGLSEVLAGRVAVTDALQRSPRQPRMRVLTAGTTPTAAGLQSPLLPATLAALARQARYVVVDAPPATVSADAQSLARHADAALLVVEQRRTRLAGVVDAADQLHRVGTPLLGAVVVGHRRESPDRAAGPSDSAVTSAGSPTNGRPTPYPLRRRHGEPGHDDDGQTMVMPRLDPAPLDPAPLDPAPLDPAPLDPAPLDPAPLDPAPLAIPTQDPSGAPEPDRR